MAPKLPSRGVTAALRPPASLQGTLPRPPSFPLPQPLAPSLCSQNTYTSSRSWMGLEILPPILAALSWQQDPNSVITSSERTSVTIQSKATTQSHPTMHLGTVCYYDIP